MPSPITFSEVDSIPDILSTNRHVLMFPSVSSLEGYELTLRNTSISIPATGISQINVNYLGHTVSFRGNSSSEHVLSCEFYEDSDGTVLNLLKSWFNIIRNRNTGGGGFKDEYASNATLYVFDTTGNATHMFTLINVWPIMLNYPQLSQDSGPFQVTVQFSVDAVDLDSSALLEASTGTTYTSQTYGNPYSESNGGSTSNVFDLTNRSILGMGGSGGGFGLSGSISPSGLGLSGGLSLGGIGGVSGGVSLGPNGLGVNGSISLGAFSMDFGSLFSF